MSLEISGRTGRGRGVTGRLWLAIAALIVTVTLALVCGFALFFELRQFAKVGGTPTITSLGSAGEFFSVVIGIPLALLTLVAGVLGFVHFTSRRDEFEILKFFVDEICKPLGEKMRRITSGLGSLVRIGNELRGTAFETMNNADESDKDPSEIFEGLSQERKVEFESVVGRIKECFGEWRNSYLAILDDIYGSVLAQQRIDEVISSREMTPVRYVRARLPESLHEWVFLAHRKYGIAKDSQQDLGRKYPDDPRELFDTLEFLLKQTVPSEGLIAAVVLGENQTTLEYLGALVHWRLFDLKEPLRRDGISIHGYFVNSGAAMILTLYQYLLTRNSLREAFRSIFGTRSDLADRFLSIAAPDKRQFASASFNDSLDMQMGQWNRFIIVRTGRGNEFFDIKRHGSIPADLSKYKGLQ